MNRGKIAVILALSMWSNRKCEAVARTGPCSPGNLCDPCYARKIVDYMTKDTEEDPVISLNFAMTKAMEREQ